VCRLLDVECELRVRRVEIGYDEKGSVNRLVLGLRIINFIISFCMI
jgi:hypothetical protein